MDTKNMTVANFNIVFLTDDSREEPMLTYFDVIVYPAMTCGWIRKSGGEQYIIMNVKVMETDPGDYVLVGNIVKKTVLEIKSDLDENGELIEKDDNYTAAPYSTFAIYLKNHRMVFVQNQKGSPTIKNFRTTVHYLITRYTNYLDQNNKDEGKKDYPLPIVNIVGIPMQQSIKDTLKEVKRIERLTLRFYPLNGDLDFQGMFSGMATELRQKVCSKNGEVILKSPKSVDGIAEVIEEAQGTVEPIFNVAYNNGSSGTISNDMMSEKAKIQIESNEPEEQISEIVRKGKEMQAILYVSKSNERVYLQHKCKVIPFLPKE